MSASQPPVLPDEDLPATQETAPAARPGPVFSPVVVMTLVIAVLLALLVTLWAMGTLSSKNGRVGSADVARLRAEVASMANHTATGPSPGGEQIGDIAERMKKDSETIVSLADRYQKLIDDLHAESVRVSAKLAESEKNRDRDRSEYYSLRKELDEARLALRSTDSLSDKFAAVQKELEHRDSEVARLKQQLIDKSSEVNPASLETLRAREARILELETAMAKMRLFANTDEELLPAARTLVATLRKLEGQPDIEISGAYSRLGSELGATRVKSLSFQTGSARLSPAEETTVSELPAALPDEGLLLVIGYASTSGNALANQKLSSDRASGVAGLLLPTKRPDQSVQAVYLGPTTRFGTRYPENNQCCEIWQIRPRK